MTARSAALSVIGSALLLVGCKNAPPPARHVAREDQVSFTIPDGFRLDHQKGTWVLIGQAGHARTTIAIRSVPVSGWSEPRTPDTVLPATLATLRALPGAKVKGPEPRKDIRYRSYEYDVVFEPRSRHGEEYERRHVVVFGSNRVFHVLLTAPRRDLVHSRSAFNQVLDSIEEEG